MKRAKLAMPLRALVISAILGGAHGSFAASTVSGKQPVNSGNVNVQVLATDNKGPLSSLSTNSYDAIKATVDSALKATNSQQVLMGGVSDGGGNAVGGTLFDFYENQDSEHISIEQLLELDPLAQQIIKNLNVQIPAVKEISKPGLGTLLVNHLRPKKIYLESKPITSVACINQSMVGTLGQTIVACQSDSELRMNKQWLLSVDSQNRVGLILHELVLAWLKVELKGKFEKKAMEQKVRELNRAIFSSPNGEAAVSFINDSIGVKAFSAKNYALMQALPTKLAKVTTAFCTNPKQGPSTTLKEYFADKFLYAELPMDIKLMQKTSNKFNRYQAASETEESEITKRSLCTGYMLDQKPVTEPGWFNGFSERCLKLGKQAMFAAETIEDYTKGHKDMEETARKTIIAKSIGVVANSAYECSGLNGGSDDSLYDFAQVVTWELKTKAGIEISFVTGTVK